jgi:hypothetical protein
VAVYLYVWISIDDSFPMVYYVKAFGGSGGFDRKGYNKARVSIRELHTYTRLQV